MNTSVDSYEERMSRIKARSQQIVISRKKKQRRIISVFAPVLACGIAMLIMLPKNNNKLKPNGDSLQKVPQTSIEDIATDKSVLYLEGDGYNKTITDQKTITAVKEMLASYFVGDQLASSAPSGPIMEDDSEYTEKRETLSIQFSNDGDVIEKSYLLIGNDLKCLQTGKMIRLSEDQVRELRRYIQ